jgi:primosomal protein N' (replication factor Y) (superfamily II helicase)
MDQELFADVVIDLPVKRLDRLFTYRVPTSLATAISRGSVVHVPFSHRTLAGFVVNLRGSLTEEDDPLSIKDILSVIRCESFWAKELIELSQWMQSYYGCTLLEALRASLPPGIKIAREGVRGKEKLVSQIRLAISEEELPKKLEELGGKSPRQAEALRYLSSHEGPIDAKDLREKTGVTAHIIRELAKKDLVSFSSRQIFRNPSSNRSGIISPPLELNDDQARSMEKIASLMKSGKTSVMLLHGVTGSGKTEIYLQALQKCLQEGKTGLVLIPEISLTTQTMDRFRGRFGSIVALLHSQLRPGERYDEWNRIWRGEARIVLGARSAAFAPLDRIGIIIIDEEHETSYKQEHGPRYHARHIAIRRAQAHRALVILGSATPSMESFYWAQEGKYSYYFLPRRVLERKAPSIKIIDLRRRFNRAGEGTLLSPYLVKKMEQALARREQIILFLNRRGLFNYLFCEECGHIMKCPHCAISLRVYGDPPGLRCHYCLFEKEVPGLCPLCAGHTMAFRGGGTQKAESEIRTHFPGARILRMDSDTTAKKGSHEIIYDTFARRQADILLGTQMITKGFDFPGVTLVGVLLADTALSLPDFRASERTYQLLHQVAGRTSRGDLPGEVVIQTYNAQHPSIVSVARHDSLSFYEWEIGNRRELSYPPLLHFIRILFSSGEEEEAKRCAAAFKHYLTTGPNPQQEASILGPSPCPLMVLQNLYRHQIIIKCRDVRETVKKLAAARQSSAHLAVRITTDVDPVSFL